MLQIVACSFCLMTLSLQVYQTQQDVYSQFFPDICSAVVVDKVTHFGGDFSSLRLAAGIEFFVPHEPNQVLDMEYLGQPNEGIDPGECSPLFICSECGSAHANN